MTSPHNKLTQIIWAWTGGNDVEGSAKRADAILAALPDIVRGMAKPLEWKETINGYISHNGYEIKADHSSRNRYYVTAPDGSDVFSAIHARYQLNPLTGAEGKAAAQAHHDKQNSEQPQWISPQPSPSQFYTLPHLQ